MLNWLFKKNNKKENEVPNMENEVSIQKQCLCLPMVAKEDLVDGKKYLIFKRYKHLRTVGLWNVKWNKQFDCFQDGPDLFDYESSIVLEFAPDSYVLDYNPCAVNELDLQNLHEIVHKLPDENTQGDEVWEALLKYFDERGIVL